jgi:hypothetical protein
MVRLLVSFWDLLSPGKLAGLSGPASLHFFGQ